MRKRQAAAVLAAVVLCFHAPPPALAGCGQAFCSIDSRLTETATLGPRALRLGLETEYIEQDQPWIGFHSADVGEIPRPDHNEVETTNLTWKLSAEVGLTEAWSVSLMLPIVHREHLHLEVSEHSHEHAIGQAGAGAAHGDEEDGNQGVITIGDATGVPQSWNFTRLGDLQLTTSYNLISVPGPAGRSLSIYAGLKLPTGDTGVRNSSGEQAEITLQPGTGSVDPIFGVRMQYRLPLDGPERFVPVSLGVHVRTEGSDGKFGYRPGTEVITSLGATYPLFERLQPAFQINFRYRDRDHAGNAPGVAPEHSGGEALHLSPGLRLALTDDLDALGYVQVPVVQRVNGIQVVSRWNLLFALTYRFEI